MAKAVANPTRPDAPARHIWSKIDPRQGRESGDIFRPVVAFDFDGTLTCRDSFRDYLAWRSGWPRYAAGLAALTPAGLAYLRQRDRGRLKAAMVRRFLRGATRGELEAQASEYARTRSRGLLRPDALRCWRDWRGRGARLVIVTATPDIIVAPFARGLGADLLIGTRLLFDTEDRVTGALDGLNCRGEEKVRRLRQRFGDGLVLEAAYGDSDGDTAMLAIADEAGMKIFGAKP